MSDFFAEMRAMADELNTEFANGAIALVREAPGTPDPEQLWEPVTGTIQTEALFGRMTGVPQRWVDGTAILSSDEVFEGKVPVMQPMAGDRLTVDGRTMTVVAVRPEFSAGEPVLLRLVVRG